MRDPSCGGARAVAWAIAAFALLSLLATATSNGFLEADAATHYQYARYAAHSPDSLVNVWARPLATGLYALPAGFAGRTGTRLVCLACAIACALAAWRIALALGCAIPALAAIFTLGQPLLFLHSFNEMTELPFAALAGLAFWAYCTRRWGPMALAAALLPLGRPEGFGFCLLAAIALLWHRRPAWIILLPLPTAAWSAAGWLIEGRHGQWWQWLIQHWPYGSGSDYPAGSLFYFVLVLPMLVSPAALPAMWIGVARALRTPAADHQGQCRRLAAAIPIGILIVHSLLHWLGRLSSNGELRYLLVAAPFWGVLAASGWEWAFAQLNWTRPAAWAALAVIAPAQINWIIPIVPIRLDSRWAGAEKLVAWYHASPLRRQYPRLIFADPAIDYYLNTQADDPVRATPSTKQTVAADGAGFMLIWDPNFSTKNSDPTKDVTADDVLAAGWKEIHGPSTIDGGWRIFLSGQGGETD